MRTLVVCPVLLVLLLADVAGCQKPQPAATDAHVENAGTWALVSVRNPTAEDVPFEKASRYLWTSADPNNVPGPDSLRAFVRTNEESRAQIYVENLRSGTTELLFPGYANAPVWSPKGRYIACTEWKSMDRYWDLTIIEVASGRVLDGPVAATASEAKWSPDGKTLLVSGILYGVGHAVLYTVSVPDLVAHTLDEANLVASYHHSWSPDSRWVVYTRPTAIHHTAGDTVAADVWVVSAATGEQSCILESPEWIDSEPLWINNRSILIKRTHWNGTNFGTSEHKVLDLEFTQQPSASP